MHPTIHTRNHTEHSASPPALKVPLSALQERAKSATEKDLREEPSASSTSVIWKPQRQRQKLHLDTEQLHNNAHNYKPVFSQPLKRALGHDRQQMHTRLEDEKAGHTASVSRSGEKSQRGAWNPSRRPKGTTAGPLRPAAWAKEESSSF
ncbi:MAG: hypothetical protein Q9175_004535 [Cornicularia normoerica]